MARFKFHSAIEEILVEDLEADEVSAMKAVAKAADSGDFDLNENDLDKLSEAIYSNQKYWE
jgi:hypothetical protein